LKCITMDGVLLSTGPDPVSSLVNDGSLQKTTLTPWERWLPIALLCIIVGFSGIVELRSAFLKRPMTDLQVYLRAAWAVRTEADLYKATDDNGWHYHYPPLLAILLTPLADPPPDHPGDRMVPFALSVAIWYWISIACLLWGVHTLAGALEKTSRDPSVRAQPPLCGRWRMLRVLPILACLPAVGQTLVRGQVNLLVLALVCGLIAAVLRGRRFQAGLWLAAAICIKVIPAFLLVYPLWRRDLRGLAGCALGLIMGLGLIPAAVLGPERTLMYCEEWTDVLLKPAFGKGDDQSRANELINVTATDSQSFLSLLHNARHPDRETRPAQASDEVRWGHRILAGAFTLLALFGAGWSRPKDVRTEALFLGLLIIVMILASPVCHLHYFCLTIPLVVGLLAGELEKGGRSWPVLFLGLTAANLICTILPLFPGMDILRDHGLAAGGTLLYWGAGLAALWSYRRSKRQPLPQVSVAVKQAA
jgi:alpha-1,2-mannosyltransferase